MNSITRNSFRVTSSFIRSALTNPFSTIPDTAETLAIEEPDKLYKTIEIELKGNDPEVMKSYSKFAQMAADHLEIKKGEFKKPLHERNNLCLLRAAFASKKSRVQYEIRTYFRYMNFHHLTGSTADTFLEYIQRNLPEGVAMKVTKLEVRKLPEEITKALESTNNHAQ
ncbi:hypothetical protein PGB90_004486 [Kerria lacca]